MRLQALLVPAAAPVGELLGGVLDLVPPLRVVAVPADRLAQAFLEVDLRLPAELLARLVARNRVAAVMAGAVGDLPDAVVPVQPELVEDDGRDLAVRALVAAADV